MNKRKIDKIADGIFLGGIALVAAYMMICPFLGSNKVEATHEPTTVATAEVIEEEVTEPAKKEEPTEVATEPIKETQTEVKTEPMTEREMLALVIYQEAGGDACSDETREMVGTVVMNRVYSDRFPNTLYGVLTQNAQYGRLSWTGLVWADRANNPGEAHAVERAYECADKILGGYRSFGTDVVWQAEFPQGTETVAYQDGFYFCR